MSSIEDIIEDMDGRFRSGNDIPVTRATMTPEAWAMIREALQDAIKYRSYKDGRFDLGGGEYITTHINVGVNSWRDGNWLAFDEVSPDEFEAVLTELEKENAGISA